MESFPIPATHRDAVDGLHSHAQGAGAGDNGLVRVHQLHHGEGFLHHRDAVLFRQGNQMLPGDAGEDELICGGGAQHSVLQHGDIAVGALGDSAASMEHSFVTSPLRRPLAGQYAWDQIQCLDMTQLVPVIL